METAVKTQNKYQVSIDLLNDAVGKEIATSLQYMYFHTHFEDDRYQYLSKIMREISIAEMRHIEEFSDRIMFLQGDVDMNASFRTKQVTDAKEMLRLEDRLKTRFEWGLLADIQPPDYETRMAIIKNKAIRMGVELPEFLLQLIAENITANVRQIEGTVNKIMAYQDLMGDLVDKETVVRAVKDMFKEKSDIVPTAEVIIDEVCKFYNIEPAVLKGQGRAKDISMARQIAMYLIRRMTNLSLKEIGKEFEGRDHTTVLHSIERIEDLSKNDPEKAEIIKDITANINIRYE